MKDKDIRLKYARLLGEISRIPNRCVGLGYSAGTKRNCREKVGRIK